MALAVPYVELHAHSAYSFLDGASSPAELAAAAAELGYPAIALTDHDGLWGSMEFAQACRGLGIRAITGAEVTVGTGHVDFLPHTERKSTTAGAGSESGFHLTLLVETPAGYRNLCRLLTESHRGTRPRPDRDPLPPSIDLDFLERHAEGLVCLSGCARDGALAGRWERGRLRERGGARAAPAGGVRARGLPGRAAAALLAPRPPAQSLAGGPRGAARRRMRGDRERPRARPQPLAAPGRARRGAAAAPARGDRARAARQRDARCSPAPPRWRRASPSTPTRWRRAASSPRGWSSTSRATSATAIPAPTTPTRIARSPSSAGRGSRTATRGCASGPRRERRLDDELALIRRLRLSGFFLLHYDLLELAREVAAEVRGPDSARSLLPPGRGRGLERQLGRLLPDGPLARRPRARGAVPRPLPQRGDHRCAGHRPRLPARHPREADPARARALRLASARRWSPRSRPTSRAARCATSARRWGCRRARSSGWRGW